MEPVNYGHLGVDQKSNYEFMDPCNLMHLPIQWYYYVHKDGNNF